MLLTERRDGLLQAPQAVLHSPIGSLFEGSKDAGNPVEGELRYFVGVLAVSKDKLSLLCGQTALRCD